MFEKALDEISLADLQAAPLSRNFNKLRQ